MIPSVFDCIEPYRKSGRINAQCAFDALDMPNSEAAKQITSTPYTRFIIDAFVLSQQYIPALMREYIPDLSFDNLVCIILADTEEQIKSMGCTVQHYIKEKDCIIRYMIESARKNVDNPKRRGESWTARIGRLAEGIGYPVSKVMSLVQELPYSCPLEFMAMSCVSDEVLSDLIREFRPGD